MRSKRRTRPSPATILATVVAVGIGCGPGTHGTPPPTGLRYATNPAVYTTGKAITPNTPTSGGGPVSSYAVHPDLPAGLSLNGTSGAITGTPAAATAAATYTVTAANSGGSTTAALVITVNAALRAIQSFSVGADEAPVYPNDKAHPPYVTNFPDEHTTFIPVGTGASASYLVFGSSRVSTGPTGGAAVLQTTDLVNFQFATALGYDLQVMAPPVPINQCDGVHTAEFDGNYIGPGSVVQDPTLPAGNYIMLYEAENHCPGGVNQQPFYATIGFARSSDAGKSWPAPVNDVLGGPARHPVLKAVNAQPAAAGYPAMGDAIPAAIVDRSASGDYYLYVGYGYHDGGMTPASDGRIRMARAKLGSDPLDFRKWNNGAFSEPGIGGLDSGVLPGPGCPNGRQHMVDLTFNDDLGTFLMVFVCTSGPAGSQVGAWYYSTATSLDLQDWSMPQMIQSSQHPYVSPCPGGTSGGQFDGFYPSFMSPGAAAGHTTLSGRAFYMSGCDTGARQFMSRSFTITATP